MVVVVVVAVAVAVGMAALLVVRVRPRPLRVWPVAPVGLLVAVRVRVAAVKKDDR